MWCGLTFFDLLYNKYNYDNFFTYIMKIILEIN